MQYHRNIPLIQQGIHHDKVKKDIVYFSYFIVSFRLVFVFQMPCWLGMPLLIFLMGLRSRSTQTSMNAMEKKKLASLTETTLASWSGIKVRQKRPNMAWALDLKRPICQSGWPLSTISGEFSSILDWTSWSRIGKHSKQPKNNWNWH